MRQRSCQTALRVARVPRGIRAMPAKEKPRVSRGDDFFFLHHPLAVNHEAELNAQSLSGFAAQQHSCEENFKIF